MKCSVSFDPNDAIFAQNFHEGMGCVNSCIRPKLVQNWLKNQFKKKGVCYYKMVQKLLWLECGKIFP